MQSEVLALARENGIDNRLTMVGDRRDVADLVRAFDVMLVTSRWEGLPRAMIEAMATGVPVVSTAVGGVREVVEDGITGLLAATGDVDGLADGVVRVATSPDKGNSMAEAARRLVHGFSQEAMVAETEELYRALLSSEVAAG